MSASTTTTTKSAAPAHFSSGAGLSLLKRAGAVALVDTGIGLAMGQRYTFGEWVRYIGIPDMLVAQFAPKLLWPYIAADIAIGLVPASREVGVMLQTAREGAMRSTYSGNIGPQVDTRQAATMRRRALSDASAAGMTVRNALSGSGRIFHYRYTMPSTSMR